MVSSMKIEWENPWESKEMMEDAGTLEQEGDEDHNEERGNPGELKFWRKKMSLNIHKSLRQLWL